MSGAALGGADYDAVVIGAGHAGIEAALALARLGFTTLCVTQSLDAIGRMSCNPAIGGLSKGNIVREVDALGGAMGKLIDATMIQFRILNRTRGPAVQAPRAQADKHAYSALAKKTMEGQERLFLFQDTVTDLLLSDDGRSVRGVVTERGSRITAHRVVLTTGTFMEAIVFIGEYTAPSGRLGEPAAVGLGAALRRIGFEVGRLKTGTPARVARGSLDFSRMELQEGDPEMLPFSFDADADSLTRPSLPCHITHTNEETHRIIRENIHRSPLYGGKIVGVGPRYCPSIEDKVVRFPDRTRHQIFVEPEGLDTEEMYLNGISSSLPEEVQERFLRTLPGLEHVHVMRPGYAVEYDYLDPTQLFPSLETKRIRGLYVAGQTNGTSGYEEAACQGLIAGINAALSLRGAEPLILTRAEAYTGVLIDDLVTLGTKEPYRMFTSRAEHRLSLRHDTADIRLIPRGFAVGLNSRERMERLSRKIESIEAVRELLRNGRVGGGKSSPLAGLSGKTLEQALRVPEIRIADCMSEEPGLAAYDVALLAQVELDVKYEGYVNRQERQVQRFSKLESIRIPDGFDYDSAIGLSVEGREKLKKIRPLSLGQASRISGVRNSDLAVLIILLGRRKG
jgi:tRNA uridine 5-carboxymethylaminomethyl modification enzyme